MIDPAITTAWCNRCRIAFGLYFENDKLCCPICRTIWPGPIFPIIQPRLYYCTTDQLRFGIPSGEPVKCYICQATFKTEGRA